MISRFQLNCALNFFYGVVLVLTLCSCAPVGPDFTKPEANLPDKWQKQEAVEYAEAAQDLSNWWYSFNDPVLNSIVDKARNNNTSLELAALRVLEARAQLGVATGSLYPQSQLGAGAANYFSPPENTGVTSGYWQYTLGASVAWEIDFWGKFRRGVESADAAFLASVAGYEQALVLLTAQVVDTYVLYRVTEEQLRIAIENIKIQERSYKIAEVLFESGDSSELDVQQALTLLLSTKATVPSLETQLEQIKNTLGNLLGLLPGEVDGYLEERTGVPKIADTISLGIPADMLRNRPDVRQAELQAMAQNALVGVAEAGLYPSFSLAGSIGLAAGSPTDSNFGNLFGSDALTYSIGPSFVWPFLNYGRIKNNVRVQDARLQQALVNYRDVVLRAARDAENAMSGFIGSRKQAIILEKTVESAKRSTTLSTYRYSEGFSDYQRVLNSQQALFTQQQRYITNEGTAIKNLITLFQALGGGWQGYDRESQIPEETRETMEKRTDWGQLIEKAFEEQNDNPKSSWKVDW